MITELHLWDLRRDTELEMLGYATTTRELAWRHDARRLATGAGGCSTVWDFAGRGPARLKPPVLQSHGEALTWIGLRSGSSLLASTAHDGLAMLWTPPSDVLPLATVALDDRITIDAWSADGRRLTLGSAGGTLAIADDREDQT